MIILITLLLVGIALTLVAIKIDEDYEHRRHYGVLGFGSGITALIIGIIVIFLAIDLPCQRYEARNFIAEMEATKRTTDLARKMHSDVERFSFLQSINEMNKRLARYKYQNTTQWDLWIPDEIEQVQPIE